MTILMPAADQSVLARRDAIVAALRAIVPGEGVISSAAEMLPYESDGLMEYRQPPMVVVLPDTTEQVAQVLKYCSAQGIKVVPRGSGTSLSGGALPLADAVLLGLGRDVCPCPSEQCVDQAFHRPDLSMSAVAVCMASRAAVRVAPFAAIAWLAEERAVFVATANSLTSRKAAF